MPGPEITSTKHLQSASGRDIFMPELGEMLTEFVEHHENASSKDLQALLGGGYETLVLSFFEKS